MKVSVIIPTIGRIELHQTLASLRSQTRSPDELIVMHDADRRGPAATRNDAARKARGDVLLFIDDDCVAAPNWVERMSAVFEDPAITAVSGAVIYRTADHVPSHDERVVQNPEARWFMGANCGVRRDAFWKIGGFPEKYRVYEDKAFALACWSKHYGVARVPLAHVYHSASRWDTHKVKQFADHLTWWVELIRDYDVWADKHNPPPLWAGHILMPRDFAAIAKAVIRTPLSAADRLKLRLLVTQRVQLWKAAARARVFIL